MFKHKKNCIKRKTRTHREDGPHLHLIGCKIGIDHRGIQRSEEVVQIGGGRGGGGVSAAPGGAVRKLWYSLGILYPLASALINVPWVGVCKLCVESMWCWWCTQPTVAGNVLGVGCSLDGSKRRLGGRLSGRGHRSHDETSSIPAPFLWFPKLESYILEITGGASWRAPEELGAELEKPAKIVGFADLEKYMGISYSIIGLLKILISYCIRLWVTEALQKFRI
jgi:hypothetical protein